MIVEIKSVEVLAPVHKKQLLTYLRLADKRLGLLINFNAALIKDGITRIVNGLEEESHAKPQGRQQGGFSPLPLSFPMASICIIRGADPLVGVPSGPGPPGPALPSKNQRLQSSAGRPGGRPPDQGVRHKL